MGSGSAKTWRMKKCALIGFMSSDKTHHSERDAHRIGATRRFLSRRDGSSRARSARPLHKVRTARCRGADGVEFEGLIAAGTKSGHASFNRLIPCATDRDVLSLLSPAQCSSRRRGFFWRALKHPYSAFQSGACAFPLADSALVVGQIGKCRILTGPDWRRE